MKRILTIAICLLASIVLAHAESTSKCLLQHQGTVQLFDADKIANAITAAVDGDTIYLTAGEFPGFTINKKITVRGAGQATKITDNVSINISGTPTLTQTVLEGVNLGAKNKNIYLASAMKGVKIKQCSMYNLRTSANNSDVIIDRCYISNELEYSTYIKSMTVVNSSFSIGSSTSSSTNIINFINCDVWFNYPSNVAGTFINCAIRTNNTNSGISNCAFVNCLFRWSAAGYFNSTTSAQQCYYDASCSWDAATFEELRYLGNDGRVVGYMGGVSPYTLDLAVPKVTESQISLDPDSRVLNVNIKVSAK